jgi:hypothetical protein
MASTLHASRQIWILWFVTGGGHLKTLVYAALVDNEEALHHRIVGACQIISNYHRFEWMLRSMMRRVEVCIESRGGHFEHLL